MLNSEIISEARGIIQELDADNSHVSDATFLQWIDACTLQLASLLNTLPKEKIQTVYADDTVTLPSKMIRLDFATIADAVAGVHHPLTTMDFVNFCKLFPEWEDQADGDPTYLIRMTDTQWMMWPPPNASAKSNLLTLVGSVNPTTGAVSTGSPELSQTLHPAYPHYLAWKAFMVLNNPARAQEEFNIFDGIRKMNMRTATSTTGSLLAIKVRGNY